MQCNHIHTHSQEQQQRETPEGMAGKLNVCENQIYYNTVHNKTVMQNRCHEEYYIYEENHHKKTKPT